MPSQDGRATAVVAIGGNALAPAGETDTIANQFRHTRESLVPIVDFVLDGWDVAVVHGNGPQVGDALLRNERSRDAVSELPLGVLVASTAGWIGYMIQQSLQNALLAAGSRRQAVTLITQTEFDANDPGLTRPTKAIGREVDSATARALREEGAVVEEDARGRLRRVVGSPMPTGIVEASLIRQLVHEGHIVVAAGGGGTPVTREPGGPLEGQDVVIDKDLAAAILAREIGASVLLILTDVDGVYRDYGTDAQERIEQLSVAEARELMESGQVGEGSMAPKLGAALRFVANGGDRAIIADLTGASDAVRGRSGTTITSSDGDE